MNGAQREERGRMVTIETRPDPENPAAMVVTEDGRPVLYFHESDRGWTWESGKYGAGDVYPSRNAMLNAARQHLAGIGREDLSDAAFGIQYPRNRGTR